MLAKVTEQHGVDNYESFTAHFRVVDAACNAVNTVIEASGTLLSTEKRYYTIKTTVFGTLEDWIVYHFSSHEFL